MFNLQSKFGKIDHKSIGLFMNNENDNNSDSFDSFGDSLSDWIKNIFYI